MHPKPDIVMLCDWLPPDFGAVGQYAVRFAESLAAAGSHVVLYGFNSQQATTEISNVGLGSCRIERIHMPSYDRRDTLRRALWTVRANLGLLWNARKDLVHCREIRFTGSPPYLLHFVMPVAKILGKRTRYRITDFHPECLMAAKPGRAGWALEVIAKVTRFWRRRVDTIEVLGNDQKWRLEESRVDPGRVELLRDPSPIDIGRATGGPLRPPGAGTSKLILYSGNWGVAHDDATFVDAFERFDAAHPGVAVVWLNATGAKADLVEQHLRARRLPVIRTQPVPLEELPRVLLAADLHLITLCDDFVGYVMPSKVYACIEAGGPVLFIGSQRSDVHELCLAGLPPEHYGRADVGDSLAASRLIDRLLQPELMDFPQLKKVNA